MRPCCPAAPDRSRRVCVAFGVAFAALAVLAGLTGCATAPPPAIVAASAWGSTPGPASGRPHTVSQVTVHYQGEFWTHGADVPAYLRRLQLWSRAAKGWVDVPYHYIIGPDGTIYAGRSPTLAGDTNTEYGTQGHLQVMLLGNFEEQAVTPRQWDSTVHLLGDLLKTYDLPATRIAAHRHHATQTVCPGAGVMARFEALRAAAARARGG